MLNLGCGRYFDPNWTNVDLDPSVKGVLKCDLRNGIPFEDQSFDVVYHSHVLEHYTREDGKRFVKECWRVLTPGGVLRVVVPDLEEVTRCYLEVLESAEKSSDGNDDDYEWMTIELLDQLVRRKSGGAMKEYLSREHIRNLDFIISRTGFDGREMIKAFAENRQGGNQPKAEQISWWQPRRLRRIPLSIAWRIGKLLRSINESRKSESARETKFRNSGEVHQWMYDRHSLRLLMRDAGFSDIRKVNPFESRIQGWSKYNLDFKGKEICKPASLYMEGVKSRESCGVQAVDCR